MSERVGSEAPKGDGEHFHFGNAAVRAGDVFRPVLRKVAATSLDGLEAALRDFAFDDPQGQAAPFIAYGLGGVRVLLHVDAPRDGKHLVRITAAISTVPRVILNADRRMKLID